MTSDMKRWLGIGGIAFVVLLVASAAVTPTTPSSHANAAKVVAYYHQHKTGTEIVTYILEAAILVGVFFFWYLRDYLSEISSNRRLATIGFAGAVLFAVSGGITAGIDWALADAVDHVNPTVMQSLNALQTDLPSRFTGVGVAIFLVATGIAVIRSGNPLPRWLGWVGIVFGALSLVIPFFGFVLGALWILIAGILILLRANQTIVATNE